MQVLLLSRRAISSIYQHFLLYWGVVHWQLETQDNCNVWSSKKEKMVEQVAPDVFLPSAGHKSLFFCRNCAAQKSNVPPLFFPWRQCPRKLKWSLPSCPHLTRCHCNLVRHFHLADVCTMVFYFVMEHKNQPIRSINIIFMRHWLLQSKHRFLQTRLNFCLCYRQ